MQTAKDLQLLLMPYDDQEPILKDGISSAAAAHQGAVPKNQAESFWDETDDPEDLEAQRWGVIAPEGAEGDRLLAWIQPLIEARREAQGGDEVKVFRVPSSIASPEEASRWGKLHFEASLELERDLPRYQLILGDLHQVSLAVQQVQSATGFVGRLSFREEREYQAYVDKVLRWERARVEASAIAKFFTVHDGTAATTIGYGSLTRPALAEIRNYQLEVADLGNHELPSPDEFLEAVRSPEPAVLFSVSHGAGAPRGGWKTDADQRDRQGAISFGREGKLSGLDLGDGPFLPGGIWFMLACYGAGTPLANESAYAHWLESLKKSGQYGGPSQAVLAGLPKEGQRPFIARLPQVVLANPNGPLAVMGHIDLAWTYSFEERDTGKAVKRPSKFVGPIRGSLEARRVGSSFRELLKASIRTNLELTNLYDKAEREGAGRAQDATRLGHLWMLRQDLSGYILLGDPAVRLPATRRRPKAAARSSIEPRVAEVRTPAAAPAPIAAAAEPQAPATTGPRLPPELDIDDVERAIGKVLGGSALNAVAAEHGIEPAKLRELKSVYKAAGRAALGEK